MEVLDTTIANVALRYIAGGLSAPVTDSEWVITSYLAANAIILPISGWLATRLGRRNYFLLSIAVFTLASALCGMATSLNMLIAFRVLQGLAGGGLAALQPGRPARRLSAGEAGRGDDRVRHRGAARARSSARRSAATSPTTTAGAGSSTSTSPSGSWRCSCAAPSWSIPEYLKAAARAAARDSASASTRSAWCLLAVTMVCWEIMLSKGQEWDWLGDPFLRVQTLLVLFVLCLAGADRIAKLRIANPLINFRTLKDRNFRSCCIIIFCAFGVLYANTTTLPALLQSLFGYDATTSGLVLSPAGVFCASSMLFVVGILLGRGVDARYLMAAGLLTLAAGNYWMSRMNLDISPWQVVWPRVVVIAGLSMMFAPLNVAAFMYIPPRLRAAVGLLALLRNEGGSVGTSMAQTILERREQFHVLRLNEKLDALYPAVQRWLEQGRDLFMHGTGDPVRSQQMALRSLQELRDRQAAALAYFDVFWSSAVVAALMVFLVLLMRRSVAEKGAHVGAE